MCTMVFQVQGKTDNYVRLKIDGKGISFMGNKPFCSAAFKIQDEALTVTFHNLLRNY